MKYLSMLTALPMADLASSFMESTLPGKAIVFILLLGSSMAWTIMWTKGAQLRSTDRMNTAFLKAFRAQRDPAMLFSRQETYPGAPLATIYQAGFHALSGMPLPVHGVELETLRAAVEQHAAEEALQLESQMGMLATAVSAAPFLGLLGTVWGVMDAFSGMAESGTAALSEVAPGISGALLTTIAGLFVALPSMIGYNLLSTRIRRMCVQMENFAQEFVSEMRRTRTATDTEGKD